MIKRITIPHDQEKLDMLMDTFNQNLEICENHIDNLDKFYKSLLSAAHENNCLTIKKPGARVKKYLYGDKKKTYEKLIKYQMEVKGTDKEE